MTAPRHIRVGICDDHEVVREGIRHVLVRASDIEVIGEAANGEEAVALAAREPDVLLMDVAMPELDGISASKRIKRLHPAVQILVLTALGSEADVLRALQAGATGYMMKDAPRDELYRAVRLAASGLAALSPGVAGKLVRRTVQAPEVTLSAKEIEVLQLVADGSSRKQIAGALWISEETVKNLTASACGKLGASDRVNAVAVAVGRGLIRGEPARDASEGT